MSWPNITEGAETDHLVLPVEGLAAAGSGNVSIAAAPDAESVGQVIIDKIATQQFGESEVSLSGAT